MARTVEGLEAFAPANGRWMNIHLYCYAIDSFLRLIIKRWREIGC